MSDYASNYTRAVRYGREPLSEAAQQLLHAIDTDPAHREPGSTHRLILADALDECGRHEEAAHARSKFPMSVRDGKTQLSTLRLHRLLSQMRNYYGGEHIQGGEPSPLRLEAAAELEKLGRKHEAGILRSNHEISTNTLYTPGNATFSVTGNRHRYAYGGGEIYYHANDGGILCHNCANGENGSMSMHQTGNVPGNDDHWDNQWAVDDGHIHEEGDPLNCDHCGREIESAYGDPDADEEGDQ